MNRIGEPDAFKLSKQEAEVKLSLAKEEFATACVRSDELQENHEMQLTKALAIKNNTSEEAELKKLRQTAKQKKRSARLRKARKKPNKGLATQLIEIVDNQETLQEEQPELVRISTNVNQTRFTNCRSCAFFHGALLQDIGLLAEGPAVLLIVEGR